MTARFAVSGWSAVSPFGIGADAFRDGVRAGRSAVRELQRADWQVPAQRAGLVPSFDIRTVLGRKNTRSMDRATALAVSSVGMLLDGHEADLRAAVERSVGLVLGTTTGSVQSMMDFTRDSLTQDKPFHVDPARFPAPLTHVWVLSEGRRWCDVEHAVALTRVLTCRGSVPQVGERRAYRERIAGVVGCRRHGGGTGRGRA